MVSSISSLHQIFLKGLSGSGWENRGAFVFGGHAAAWPSTATALMVWFMEGTSWSWLEVDFPDIDGNFRRSVHSNEWFKNHTGCSSSMYFRPAVANKRGQSLCVSEGKEPGGSCGHVVYIQPCPGRREETIVVYSSGQITYGVTGLL